MSTAPSNISPHSSPAKLDDHQKKTTTPIPSESKEPSDATAIEAAVEDLDWKLLHSLGMMCATVYKSGKAIREVYGKHAFIHKSTPPLRAFLVHNDTKKAQRLIVGGTLLPLPPSIVEDDPAEHYKLPELAKRLLAGLMKNLRKDLAIELAGHGLGGVIAVLLSEALVQAGFKVSTVTTFGQPRFRSSSSGAAVSAPLRVVLHADPAFRLFGQAGRYNHNGPDLVLLPDLEFFYARPSAPSLPVSPGASPLPSPFSRDRRPTKGSKRDSSSPRRGKKESKEKSASSQSSRELQQIAEELSGEHRMETYLRNLKTKVRGTPRRVPSLDS